MPPALTTTSAPISWRSPRCSTVTPVTRGVRRSASRVDRDADDPCVGPDVDAALARTGSEGLGEAGRVQPAVGRQPHRAKDAVGRHQRESVAAPRRRDEVHRQAECLGPAGLALQLLHPRRARRQADRADLVPRRIDAGLVEQPPVQRCAVHHHPREGHGTPELADQARAVEGRTAGELRALDEDDVRPAAFGQVVGDRCPADPAADDDDPRMLHGSERRRSAGLRAGSPRRGPLGWPA